MTVNHFLFLRLIIEIFIIHKPAQVCTATLDKSLLDYWHLTTIQSNLIKLKTFFTNIFNCAFFDKFNNDRSNFMKKSQVKRLKSPRDDIT